MAATARVLDFREIGDGPQPASDAGLQSDTVWHPGYPPDHPHRRHNFPAEPDELKQFDLHYDSHGTLLDARGRAMDRCSFGEGACGRFWAGAEVHCPYCHRHFASGSAWQAHLVRAPQLGSRPFPTCQNPPRHRLVRTRFGRTWV